MQNSFLPLTPHDQNLETSILASVLIDSDNDELFDTVKADDFYRTSHQKIYAAMICLYGKKEPVDLVTIKNKLVEMGDLEAIGGAGYLVDLLDNAPYVADKEGYIKLLLEKSARRKLLTFGHELMKMSVDQTTGIDSIIASMGSTMNTIDQQGDTKTGYSKLCDLVIPTIERYENLLKTGISGISTGFKNVDTIIGSLQDGDLTIVAGRPGMGKSAFAMCMALSAAKSNIPVGVFSLEMSESQNMDRVLAGQTKINLSKFRTGRFSQADWTELVERIDKIRDWPLLIDATPGLSYKQLRRRVRVMVRKHGIRMAVVDYIQLMTGDKGGNRETEVSSISRALKLLAKEMNMPVIAMSQLNRGLESRDNKRPRLSDLRESGAIEQDADNILFLYRDEVYNHGTKDKGVCEVEVAKQRMGPVDRAKIKWVEETAKFENLEMWDR